ncbi:glycosyltransferase [Polaribacter sp. R2A056_3_33]|uniref:glycosyltransferase n=1 Tax=Polaribacter sp. R2A056_3_33 TaxID=2745563 RepID=UPI001C4F6838|nr:glycosyltransferase [Polaribacter sp. R2A056_3_33]QXP69081.1 glycosyltransferase [Polaribacter sp. R2A056_3_33]
MKINHIISSIDKSSGGPARSVTHLIDSVLRNSNEIEIILNTLESNNPIITKFDSTKGSLYFNKKGLLKYSRPLDVKLIDSDSDLFHGHGIWQLPVYQMAKIARKLNKPYIITPRGMLEPWSLTQGQLKKKIALKTFQTNDLEKASCIHATAQMEVESIRNLGFINPIAMIPNGVNIDEFPASFPEKSNTPKKILFLSRIHIKKGIENLIEAWGLIDNNLKENWKIEIVGNGDENYIKTLKEKIISENLTLEIEIKKPVFGADKIKLFREASLFVLPTFSENFGIVIAEALASYTPVITTKGTPWEDLSKNNSGWWIDVGTEPLKIALEEALNTKEETLFKMGINGRGLIENKYSMDSVGNQMIELYNWILLKEDKPSFVDIV